MLPAAIAEITDYSQIDFNVQLSSKKRLLEHLAELLESPNDELCADNILSAFVEREKLGATAIGNHVAIPHCRVSNCTKPRLAIVTTQAVIDYDAGDDHFVKVAFGLIVPKEANDQHLQLLSNIAEFLTDIKNREFLESASSDSDKQKLLGNIY